MNNFSNRPIGIFDSGLGGISVLKECIKYLPNENFIYYGDSLNAPYGTKSKAEIINYCIKICDLLVSKDCKAIVIACNTATSAAVNLLRNKYSIPIIGMEPALKVACDYKEHQNVAVLATSLTLKEKKFEELMNHYAGNNTIYKIACPDLVEFVENDELNNEELISKTFNNYFKDINLETLNSMVLGCTHFVFFKTFLNKTYPNIKIIDGHLGTVNHLKNLLKNKLNNSNMKGVVVILNSNPMKNELGQKLLDR